MRKSLTFLLSLFLIQCFAFGQDSTQVALMERFSNNITQQELANYVQFLASDQLEGRDTGKKGQKIAAEYIKNEFKAMGLAGASASGDPYYQEFLLVSNGQQKIYMVSEGDTIMVGKDFTTSSSIPEVTKSVEFVFVGYGIESPKYSDYLNMDVKGKVVVFMGGEPLAKDGKYLVSGSFLPKYTSRGMDKAELAASKGAIAAIRIEKDSERFEKLINMYRMIARSANLALPSANQTENEQSIGILHLNMETAAKLMKTSTVKLEKSMLKMNKGRSEAGKYTAIWDLTVEGSGGKVETENVAAWIRGTEYPDECIVVTAHYDHLGKRGDNIFNGADDNATGTAAVLEVAETFSEMAKFGVLPKRSILFLPVSGEEKGLLGSRYYVENPIFPISKTKATVNLDMVGRSDSKHVEDHDYVYLYISDTLGSQLDHTAQIAAKVTSENLHAELIYKKEKDFKMGGSDHAPFEGVGVPVFYFHCGLHEDYHRPTDTSEKIEYAKLTSITKMTFASVWYLANK